MNFGFDIISVGIWNSAVARKNVTASSNRTLTMFEIELPIEEGGISYIDSEHMPIEPDMLICAKPGQTRHSKFPLKCYYIHVNIKDAYLREQLLEASSFIKTSKYDRYKDIFSRMCKYYDSGDKTDEIMLVSLVLELLYLIIKESKKSKRGYNLKNGGAQSIDATVKYIKDNLIDVLTLESVAARAGFSPVHFHNIFKTAVGKTLHEFVEEQRIKKAVNLLITTDMTLTEIAYECGFSSQSYFSYAFKRKMGKAPREYAKKLFDSYDANEKARLN